METTTPIEDGDNQEVPTLLYRPAQSEQKSKCCGTAGVISLINSKKNGKRLSLSSALLEYLNNPETVQIGLGDDSIVIGEVLESCDLNYTVRRQDSKGMIYAGGLVEEITSTYGLDFSDRVSITFHEVEYMEMEAYPIAVIKIVA